LIRKESQIVKLSSPTFTIIDEKSTGKTPVKIKIKKYRICQEFLDYEMIIANLYQQNKNNPDHRWDS